MTPYLSTDNGVLLHGDFKDFNISALKDRPGLIIADPPYFRIKGEFDFIWNSFSDYLADVETWAQLCREIIADNGTLYWFGGAKRIAYSQIIFDKYFDLINALVWEKAESGGLFGQSNQKGMRSFPNSSERVLMYGLDKLNLSECVETIRDYLRSEITRAKGKIVFKDINSALGTATNGGGVASACLSLEKAEPAMITSEMYGKIKTWLNMDLDRVEYLVRSYDDLRHEYETLRAQYEETRRFFDNIHKQTEIIKTRFKGSRFDHDTVKPEKIISILIETSGRPGSLVFDPFTGSGTVPAICERLGRPWIAVEINEKYCEMAANRIEAETNQLKLFSY